MLDGELVYVAACDEARGESRARVAALTSVHVAPAFDVACQLLTRASDVDDFAMDISILPSAPDPRTGGRQLQDLAFEIVTTRELTLARIKASKFARRGVRRSFIIDTAGVASSPKRAATSASGTSALRRATIADLAITPRPAARGAGSA